MKAIILNKTGGPEVLKVSEIQDPVPGKGEVCVKNQFVGINYAEILSRKGLYSWAVKRPYILGMESSGTIEDVGIGVDSKLVGQKVIVGTKYGTYAEKIVVPAKSVVPCLDDFSMEENAAFLVNYMTAWVALFKMARLQKNEKILITAAAGGVGTAAIQIASKLGCEVYGMAGSDEKIKLIKSLGAKGGFNYRSDDSFRELLVESGGLDVVLEMVGGRIFKKSIDCMKPFGRICVAGFASLDLKKWNPLSWIKTYRDIPRASVSKLADKSIAIMSTHIGYLLDENPDLLLGIYGDLKEFVVKNDIRPVISKVFQFEEAPEAHRFIESRKSYGKVVLGISD